MKTERQMASKLLQQSLTVTYRLVKTFIQNDILKTFNRKLHCQYGRCCLHMAVSAEFYYLSGEPQGRGSL